MKKLRTAAKWMWDHRGKDIWWRPAVLTSANPEESAPNLSQVEAQSIFRILEDEKLIFPFQHPKDKETAYLINELKVNEWNAFLKKLGPFWLYVTRPFLAAFKNAWALIVWLLATLIAALIAAVIKHLFSS